MQHAIVPYMKRILRHALALLAFLAVFVASTAWGGPLVVKTPAQNGVDGANLADSPSKVISLESVRTTHQLSIIFQVVKGTSAKLRLTLQPSPDATVFAGKYTCTNVALSICSEQTYSFDAELVAGKTDFTFDLPLNYPHIKVILDDPDDGTGTVKLWTIRGL